MSPTFRATAWASAWSIACAKALYLGVALWLGSLPSPRIIQPANTSKLTPQSRAATSGGVPSVIFLQIRFVNESVIRGMRLTGQ